MAVKALSKIGHNSMPKGLSTDGRCAFLKRSRYIPDILGIRFDNHGVWLRWSRNRSCQTKLEGGQEVGKLATGIDAEK